MLNVEEYINRIMEVADLARRDEKRVRNELEFHLDEILNAGKESGLTEKEVMTMVEKEFGNPQELGKMIARARGKFRTYLKKQTRKVPIALVIAVILAFAIRAVAVEAFRIPEDTVSPVVPKGSRVLVNKLASDFKADDIVIFRDDKQARIGIVKEINNNTGKLIISRKGKEDRAVSKNKIVGRVFFMYSYRF